MLYLGFELLAAVVFFLILAYKADNKSFKGGIQKILQIVKTLPMLPRTQLRVYELELQVKDLQNKYDGVFARLNNITREVNSSFVNRLDYEKDQNFALKQMKSFTEDYVSNGTFKAFAGDLVKDVANSLRSKANKKDAAKVLEAVASLEKSLEARLTPSRPTKNSRAKLKVVKKGR